MGHQGASARMGFRRSEVRILSSRPDLQRRIARSGRKSRPVEAPGLGEFGLRTLLSRSVRRSVESRESAAPFAGGADHSSESRLTRFPGARWSTGSSGILRGALWTTSSKPRPRRRPEYGPGFRLPRDPDSPGDRGDRLRRSPAGAARSVRTARRRSPARRTRNAVHALACSPAGIHRAGVRPGARAKGFTAERILETALDSPVPRGPTRTSRARGSTGIVSDPLLGRCRGGSRRGRGRHGVPARRPGREGGPCAGPPALRGIGGPATPSGAARKTATSPSRTRYRRERSAVVRGEERLVAAVGSHTIDEAVLVGGPVHVVDEVGAFGRPLGGRVLPVLLPGVRGRAGDHLLARPVRIDRRDGALLAPGDHPGRRLGRPAPIDSEGGLSGAGSPRRSADSGRPRASSMAKKGLCVLAAPRS